MITRWTNANSPCADAEYTDSRHTGTRHTDSGYAGLWSFVDSSEFCRQKILANRHQLTTQLQLSAEPLWLKQVHGVQVLKVTEQHQENAELVADASVSDLPSRACVIQSADCLPVLLCSDDGRVVAAAHAGWRGLANGVLSATVEAMNVEAAQLSAYLGPAISQKHFEVGSEVREAFIERFGSVKQGRANSARKVLISDCFRPSALRAGYYYADLYQLARLALQDSGLTRIFGGTDCTYGEKERFYSYRRDGQQAGRMASLIWIED